MTTLTFSETRAFFKELDEAGEQKESFCIRVLDPVEVGSGLWKRLRKTQGFGDDIKSITLVTGIDHFPCLTVVFGGLLMNLLGCNAFKSYRIKYTFAEATFPVEIELERV